MNKKLINWLMLGLLSSHALASDALPDQADKSNSTDAVQVGMSQQSTNSTIVNIVIATDDKALKYLLDTPGFYQVDAKALLANITDNPNISKMRLDFKYIPNDLKQNFIDAILQCKHLRSLAILTDVGHNLTSEQLISITTLVTLEELELPNHNCTAVELDALGKLINLKKLDIVRTAFD